MNDKSKLELVGEIAQANNKNLELIQEIDQLQSNWNSLREWLEEQQKEVFHIGDKIGIVDSVSIDVLLDKMNELEGVDNENISCL